MLSFTVFPFVEDLARCLRFIILCSDFFLPDPSIPPSPCRSLSPLITCPNARIDTQHKGVFQAAKWRYGLISLDVWSVFLTNSQISAREECQQGSAGWDKLRQVTTGGRREVCMWNYRNSMHSSQTYRVKIKHISAIKLQRGFARVCVRKGRGKVCGHLSLMMDRVWLESLSVSFCSTFCVCVATAEPPTRLPSRWSSLWEAFFMSAACP